MIPPTGEPNAITAKENGMIYVDNLTDISKDA
jgi:hypothetical protein